MSKRTKLVIALLVLVVPIMLSLIACDDDIDIVEDGKKLSEQMHEDGERPDKIETSGLEDGLIKDVEKTLLDIE